MLQLLSSGGPVVVAAGLQEVFLQNTESLVVFNVYRFYGVPMLSTEISLLWLKFSH
jgi:hypothetical protein